jgi:hypothetical protein
MPAAGNNDLTVGTPPPLLDGRTQHHDTAVLVHTAWAGWCYEISAEEESIPGS